MKTDLLKAKILKSDRSVPRYTSYPTAPHFIQNFDKNIYKSWLNELSLLTDISLYIHIPFCSKMCFYCGCHTKVTQRYAPISTYLSALKKEAEITSGLTPSECRITHLHFGGGSPTMLESEDFLGLVNTLRSLFTFSPECEIAIEADPRQMTSERIQAYVQAGVNRISLGVQDFHEPTMVSINRRQPYALTEQAVKELRDAGINHINFDLMYGLPHQTTDTIRKTMLQTIDLNPNRISFFGYAHVPWMKKHMQLMPNTLPNASERYDLATVGANILHAAGYIPVGIDHFVHPDDPMAQAATYRTLKRNFQGYTTDPAEALIGLGASSISKLPQGYIQNTPHNILYYNDLVNGLLPSTRGYATTQQDKIYAEIIEQLMCYLTVDLNQIAKKYIIPINAFEPAFQSLSNLAADNLIQIHDHRITISPEARQITRVVCAAFDQYLPTGTAQHSKAI